jgi:hypothetical protein
MCRLSHRSEHLAVYDDVLTQEEFKQLFGYLNGIDYYSVHAYGRKKVWRLHDGDPLRSRAGWYYATNTTPTDKLLFPTNTPIDHLVQSIIERAGELEALIGKAGAQWQRFSFTPYIYPQGSGLSLHQDGNNMYSGAFTYFAHPDWRLHWGGHLMVLDEPAVPPPAQPTDTISPPFLSDDPPEITLDPGFAYTVFAKPNRMAFLSPTCRHVMTRVDRNAGQSARISVTGFFHIRT